GVVGSIPAERTKFNYQIASISLKTIETPNLANLIMSHIVSIILTNYRNVCGNFYGNLLSTAI
uniref:hypothetical protein n=1 Tax=Acinetobacter baumannii TaxID=470 RepID=UPI001BB3A923